MRADLTDITLIVDRSGSMVSIAEETRSGIRTFIQKQKEVKGQCLVSLCEFDTEIERPFTAVPIGMVGEIPLLPRGGTALLDAIGTTISGLGQRLANMPERERPGRVMVVIVTDGEENSSLNYNIDQINKMITEQRDVYKWDFVFLGANQDAIATASRMGIGANNAITYGANPKGVIGVYASLSENVAQARTTGDSMANVGFSNTQRITSLGEDDENSKAWPFTPTTTSGK